MSVASTRYLRGLPLPRLAVGCVWAIVQLVGAIAAVFSFVGMSSCGSGDSMPSNSMPSTFVVGVRNGLTTVDRKVVSPWGSATTQDSLLVLTSLYGPFQLPVWLVLPSRHTRTWEFSGRSRVLVVVGPFRVFKALATCYLALNFCISTIAFLTARAL